MSLRSLLNVVAADLRELMGDEGYDEWRDVPEPVTVRTEDGPAKMATPPRPPANRNVSALLAITKTMPREA